MTELNIFMVVFTAQILLLSAYYPSRVLSRAKYILKNYPPEVYPKLYPKSEAFFSRSITIYKYINVFNFISGWVLWYFIYSGDLVADDGINPLIPWGYFMLQMVPSQWLEFYGFKLSQLMKQQDTRTTRSAKLTPRSFKDYVSPKLIGLVVLSYLAFVALAFYLDQFEFSSDSKGFLMSAILLLGYGLFLVLSAWLIYGKKGDPYQSQKDRQKTVGLVIQTFCFTLLACVAFMAVTLVSEVTGMKSTMPIMMSLFLQFLVVISMGYMLNNVRMEDIDFNVYKAQ